MLRALLEQLNTLPELRSLALAVESGDCPAALSGVQGVQRALLAAAMHVSLSRPVVLLCGDEREARQAQTDLSALLGCKVPLLTEREWNLRPGATASRESEHSRLAALYALSDETNTPPAIVATSDALLGRTMPPEALRSLTLSLRPGGRAEPSELAATLLSAGYTRVLEVEGPGQFALRGGILDVFSPAEKQPVRLEFFDDEIDSMGSFDPATQRRTENIDSCLLLPAQEALPRCAPGGSDGLSKALIALAAKVRRRKGGAASAEALLADAEKLANGASVDAADRYLPLIWPEAHTALDYLPPDAVVFFCESGRAEERLRASEKRFSEDCSILMESGIIAAESCELQLGASALLKKLADFPVVLADAFPAGRYCLRPRTLLTLTTRQLSAYAGSLDTAVSDLEHYRTSGTAVVLLCSSETRLDNMERILRERGLKPLRDSALKCMPEPGALTLARGGLSAGSEWPALKLAILTEGQLTEAPRRKAVRASKKDSRTRIQSYTDLKPGDLVVHVHHGLGRFAGMQRLPVDGVQKDYLRINYAGSDCLYVPATQLDLVSKYIGAGEEEDGAPRRLNKLGGTEWGRQTAKAKKAVKDLAKKLTALYAARARVPGHAFSPDSVWQREFEDAFPYEETDDQLRAVAEIKADMEKPRPMDRLLCGDVGYGKTEVALRAVMKCILDGKQAAILVPTTVLARQHFATAGGRFRDFPVRIECLTRFTSAREMSRILDDLKAGQIDLLIGTHRLLNKSLEFKDLGLLVIDEEQRFGVTHKERLKEMSRQVDVLTLSATPIPRTLNMALSGLRDMSTLEEPPRDRQTVQTYVMEHDWALLEDAMRRELARGGQVYYLHNRVESIDRTAARIAELLGPEVRILIGHGQMTEQQLSDVMQQMVDGEADILVCTTIIETGIDIPNVNTLIVDDADQMGLAQLHQLRGRIGRSARRGYAYLTYRRGKILQETASKRLAAIREFVEFGAGFRIAMRDLEIRGAGNLLGPEQSGYMLSVGYDLYLKLLAEAVIEEQGGARQAEDCSADLTVSANIPDAYVPSAEQRMDLYRRIAAIRSNDDSEDLLDELLDRYGEPPAPVMALLDIALLRSTAAPAGVVEITQRKDELRFRFAPGAFEPAAVLPLLTRPAWRGRSTITGTESALFNVRLRPKEDVLETALQLAGELALAVKKQAEEHAAT